MVIVGIAGGILSFISAVLNVKDALSGGDQREPRHRPHCCFSLATYNNHILLPQNVERTPLVPEGGRSAGPHRPDFVAVLPHGHGVLLSGSYSAPVESDRGAETRPGLVSRGPVLTRPRDHLQIKE